MSDCVYCAECHSLGHKASMMQTPDGEEWFCFDCFEAYNEEVIEDIIEDIFGIDL